MITSFSRVGNPGNGIEEERWRQFKSAYHLVKSNKCRDHNLPFVLCLGQTATVLFKWTQLHCLSRISIFLPNFSVWSGWDFNSCFSKCFCRIRSRLLAQADVYITHLNENADRVVSECILVAKPLDFVMNRMPKLIQFRAPHG